MRMKKGQNTIKVKKVNTINDESTAFETPVNRISTQLEQDQTLGLGDDDIIDDVIRVDNRIRVRVGRWCQQVVGTCDPLGGQVGCETGRATRSRMRGP